MERNYMLVAAALISILAASGCLSSGPVDCGTDESCFSDAISSCTKATVITDTKVLSFGVIDLRYTISGSIEGSDGESCIVQATFEGIEMIGNLTSAPPNLILHLFSLTGSPITCAVPGPFSLDIEGINGSASMCSGDGIVALKEALRYRFGEPPKPPSTLDIKEAYCVGGEKIVAYVRNEGLTDINLTTQVRLIDSDIGEAIAVEWKDFAGFQNIEMLYPLKLAQIEITDLQPGFNYSYEITLGNDSYPFSVEC